MLSKKDVLYVLKTHHFIFDDTFVVTKTTSALIYNHNCVVY